MVYHCIPMKLAINWVYKTGIPHFQTDPSEFVWVTVGCKDRPWQVILAGDPATKNQMGRRLTAWKWDGLFLKVIKVCVVPNNCSKTYRSLLIC